jgi:predicted MFS family arabinose efflux permease
MGYYQMMFSVAFLLGPWGGTIVFEYLGSTILWILTLILGLLSAFILIKPEKSGFSVQNI